MIHRMLFRRYPRATATALTSVLLLAVLGPAREAPVAALGSSVQIDAPSAYDAQVVCTTSPRPGTVALSRWLRRTYPATGSLGLMRACGSGGTSEHKDGRAFDWAADVARPATRAAAYDFIRRALATDTDGNEHALARRLGIMYFIYNDTIWSSYRDFVPRPYLNSSCPSRKRCSRTLRHLNHVHISLGYAGGAAQTSWYRAHSVASIPVLYPRTSDLDPDNTAVTKLTVPATGALTTSGYYLRPGVTYRFVATGKVGYATGATGDALCVAGTPTWTPTDGLPLGPVSWQALARGLDWGGDSPGSDHVDSEFALPAPTSHGLLLANGLRWGTECRADHTYEAWYTPTTRQRVQLKYVDVPAADNVGALTVYVARDDITAASLVRK